MATATDPTSEEGAGGPTKVLVIAGPTAVGKSALALSLCERLGGEIVSADSVQVYRGLDVGSNKATAEEQVRVRHHLLDVVDPFDERFTAGRFVREADAAVDDIASRGKLPVVCGGTPLYLQVVSCRAKPPFALLAHGRRGAQDAKRRAGGLQRSATGSGCRAAGA